LEVLLDDGYWPCFSTHKPSSTNAQWGYVGEGFIKEMDFSKVWFKLNEADEGSKEDIVGLFVDKAKPFLEKALVCFSCAASCIMDTDLWPLRFPLKLSPCHERTAMNIRPSWLRLVTYLFLSRLRLGRVSTVSEFGDFRSFMLICW
jgi:hypothetical protein